MNKMEIDLDLLHSKAKQSPQLCENIQDSKNNINEKIIQVIRDQNPSPESFTAVTDLL